MGGDLPQQCFNLGLDQQYRLSFVLRRANFDDLLWLWRGLCARLQLGFAAPMLRDKLLRA
jgi:hypothetical protein